ncbi:hypothetical protein HDZ31DRAFT_49642 [Schizophyllum fasciatum]
MPQLHLPSELLHEILTCGQLEGWEKHDLARCARVSTRWNLVATPLLWEHIEGLIPLLNLMPEGAWRHLHAMHSDGVYQGILRPLTEGDWEPVYKRSCLVKTFHFRTYGSFTMAPDCPLQVVQALAACPPQQALMPHLRQLCYENLGPEPLGETHDRMLGILLSPDLTSLVVPANWQSISIDSGVAASAPLLEGLTLALDSFSPTSDACMGLIRALQHWTNLKSAHIHGISRCLALDALACLSQIRSLKSLEMICIGDDANLDALCPSFDTTVPVFPSLQSLVLSGLSPDDAASVIRSWRFRGVTLLHMTELSNTGGQGFRPVAQAIKECLDHDTLRDIRLQGWDFVSSLEFEDMQFLFPFRRLTHLRLEQSAGFSLTDEEHANVASWWPNLEVLRYEWLDRWNDPWAMRAPATLRALVHYALSCPRLQELRIFISALEAPGSFPEEVLDRDYDHPLTLLHVGNSPISDDLHDIAIAGSLVYGLFPRIQTLVSDPPGNGGWEILLSIACPDE